VVEVVRMEVETESVKETEMEMKGCRIVLRNVVVEFERRSEDNRLQFEML
jgi:hypothetical protein